MLVVIGTDCTDSCNSNYHMIMITTSVFQRCLNFVFLYIYIYECYNVQFYLFCRYKITEEYYKWIEISLMSLMFINHIPSYCKTMQALNVLNLNILILFDLLCLTPDFSYIMTTSFSGGSTQREPPTMGKQLVSFITRDCESSAPFL